MKAQAQQAYNEWLRSRFPSTIWSTGCASWYLSAKSGKNFTLWPGFTFAFSRPLLQWDRRYSQLQCVCRWLSVFWSP